MIGQEIKGAALCNHGTGAMIFPAGAQRYAVADMHFCILCLSDLEARSMMLSQCVDCERTT
jgi:hypothetical protein